MKMKHIHMKHIHIHLFVCLFIYLFIHTQWCVVTEYIWILHNISGLHNQIPIM